MKIIHKGKTVEFNEQIPGRATATLKKGRFYEQRMLRFIESLNPKNSVIDVGANIGNHSVYLATFTKAKRVYSYEPIPQIFAALEDNLKRNRLTKKVVATNIAIGSKKGKVSIDYQPKMRGNIARVKSGGKDIPMDSLDNLLKDETVDVIKIDVEGFEPEVLKGAQKLLKQQSPYLFIEAHNKQDKRVVDSLVNPLGYKSIKVFNATATYLYAKEGKYQDNKLSQTLLKLKQHRLLRRA